MAALDRALAVAADERPAEAVGHHLDLDVARALEQALDVEAAVAEGRLGLALGHLERAGQVGAALDPAHAAAPAAGGGLQQDRVAGALGRLLRCAHVADRAVRALEHRQPGLAGRRLGGDLVAHPLHDLGRRADEGDALRGAGLGEGRVLGEEAVARVDRVAAGDLGGGQDVRDVQVRVARRRRADADRLVGQVDGQRVGVGRRVDGHGRDAQLARCADDADGDLAAVGHQQLHGRRLTARAGTAAARTRPRPRPRGRWSARPRPPRR